MNIWHCYCRRVKIENLSVLRLLSEDIFKASSQQQKGKLRKKHLRSGFSIASDAISFQLFIAGAWTCQHPGHPRQPWPAGMLLYWSVQCRCKIVPVFFLKIVCVYLKATFGHFFGSITQLGWKEGNVKERRRWHMTKLPCLIWIQNTETLHVFVFMRMTTVVLWLLLDLFVLVIRCTN